MIGYAMLIAAVLVADLLLKQEAKKQGPEKKELPGGILSTGTVYNSGFAGGRFSDRKDLVKTVTALTSAAFVPMSAAVMAGGDNPAVKAGAALLLGGSLGNTYERLRYGKVTDFLSVRTDKKIGRVVFNLADVCLVCGSLLSVGGSLASLFGKSGTL